MKLTMVMYLHQPSSQPRLPGLEKSHANTNLAYRLELLSLWRVGGHQPCTGNGF